LGGIIGRYYTRTHTYRLILDVHI